MATINIEKRISLGGTTYKYIGKVTLDSSYPTGGEVLDATASTPQPGPSKFDTFQTGTVGARTFEFLPATNKLKAYGGDGAEVANATDLSAVTVPFEATGP